MQAYAGQSGSEAVLVFFRSPAGLPGGFGDLWLSATKDDAWYALLSKAPVAFRDDVMRLYVAASLCLEQGFSLLLVEGWSCHWLMSKDPEVLNGSEFGERLIHLLHDRGLLSGLPETWTDPQSRCTAEELQTALQLTGQKGVRLTRAVVGPSCPSAPRVRRYAALAGVALTVVNAREALADEEPLLKACRPRGLEVVYNRLFECLNWGVYMVSSLEAKICGRPPAALLDRLEVRLVRAFRKDQDDRF